MIYNVDGLGDHKIGNLKTRIEILNAKITSLQKRYDHRNSIVKNIEENFHREERQRLEAERINDELRTEVIKLKSKVNQLEQKVKNTIQKTDF